MAELYLKNSTGSEIIVADQGLVISDGSSITIDENEINGLATSDLLSKLSDSAANGLILSTTDVGDSSGDMLRNTAIERISMKTQWKQPRASYSSLPLDGNEDGDLRLVLDESIVYRWKQTEASWVKVTSTQNLRVEEYDESPSGDNVSKLVFVQSEDAVYIDATDPKSKIAYIGPPTQPESISNKTLSVSGTTLYTGGLSDGNFNYNSSAGEIWGTNVSYIIKDSTFTLSTPSQSTSCNYGDKGLLKVYLNGVVVADLDLEANFSVANRETSQNISNYNIKGAAFAAPIAGVVDFYGSFSGKGNLTLKTVSIYNSFKYFQKWTADINITDSTCLRQGWNEIYLVHELNEAYGGNQISNKSNFFYDTDVGANPSISSAPVVDEFDPIFKYLSGVKFYDSGSVWNVSFSVDRAFSNVYHSTKAAVTISGWPGLSTAGIPWDDDSVIPSFKTTGPNFTPFITSSMSVQNWKLTQTASQLSSNAIITATPRDPYASYTPVSSTSQNIMIFSYPNSSTNLIEHFRDEVYRLPNGNYDTIPGSFTNQWDSTQHIGTWPSDTTGLQVYMDELVFPQINFSNGYRPLSNPDYSILASLNNRTYLRAFKHNDLISYSNGILRITGVTKAQLFNGNIKIYIKAPTQTGWLDLSKDYNFATFTGIDGDGCWVDRDIQTNSDFKFTLGGRFTQNSGRMVIVKVVYPDKNSPVVSYLAMTNWS